MRLDIGQTMRGPGIAVERLESYHDEIVSSNTVLDKELSSGVRYATLQRPCGDAALGDAQPAEG